MLYFAYGSNLWIAQMKQRCPSAVVVSKAWLDGYRLTFTGHSWGWGGATATIVKDPKGKVPGAIYEIRNEDDVKRLDAYEGCPTVHASVEVLARVPKREARMKVWTYIKREEKTAAPSEEYARTISTGLREHGHKIDNLVTAMARAMVESGNKGYAKRKPAAVGRGPWTCGCAPPKIHNADVRKCETCCYVSPWKQAPEPAPKPAPGVWTSTRYPWICEKCKTPQPAGTSPKTLRESAACWLLVCDACADEGEEPEPEPEKPAAPVQRNVPTSRKRRIKKWRFTPPGYTPPPSRPRFAEDADADEPTPTNGRSLEW